MGAGTQLAASAALVVVLAAGATARSEPSSGAATESARTRVVEPPRAVVDFSLTAHTGEPFEFDALHGQTALVFFGFTNCPNVCPPTLQKLRVVERELRGEGPLTTVFVSVDGERDSPAVLKEFLEPFQPGFLGLTGDPKDVRAIAAQFSAVFFKGPMIDAKGGYNVEHTSQVYLVDRDGRIRAVFFNASEGDMTSATREVMREKTRGS